MNATDLQPEHEDTSSTHNPSDGLHLTLGIASVEPAPSRGWSQLLPDPQLALRLWTTFVANVDPLLKILHIPTTQSAMINLIADPSGRDASLGALAFSIYFASTTSLDDDEIAAISPDSRPTLLRRYRDGLNQVIMEGNLLNKPDVTSLQAITIFAVRLSMYTNCSWRL